MQNKILKYCKESEILSSVQNVERLYIIAEWKEDALLHFSIEKILIDHY